MGRIDRSQGQDATMERRHVRQMVELIDEYEQIKKKKHPHFKKVQELFDQRKVVKQNFHKYYQRYQAHNRDINALIPHKTGRKFKDIETYTPEILETIKALRAKAYNKFDIAHLLNKNYNQQLSPATVYRLTLKLGLNKLNTKIKEEKRKIIKMKAGELGHIDVHYVAKNTVKETGNKKLYIVGLIDDYSRIGWIEVTDSLKAIDIMFKSMELMMNLRSRYHITFEEILSDNGSEFSSKNNAQHPFEKMLTFYGVKHRYTKPCRPQTNGKIERFWKTLENELLDGEVFETLQEFKDYLLGYMIYYNEHRPHQGINNKKPIDMIGGIDVVEAVERVGNSQEFSKLSISL